MAVVRVSAPPLLTLRSSMGRLSCGCLRGLRPRRGTGTGEGSRWGVGLALPPISWRGCGCGLGRSAMFTCHVIE